MGQGLLITCLWYIREVDPYAKICTGMTRDGLFLIENGEIVGPVQNFRWNESPAVSFNNITGLGPSIPMHTGEAYDNPGTALDRSGHPNPVPRIVGKIRRKHAVEVEDVKLSQGTVLSILVQGVEVGTVALDGLGFADLNLDSRIDTVPVVAAGSVIVVTVKTSGQAILSGVI